MEFHENRYSERPHGVSRKSLYWKTTWSFMKIVIVKNHMEFNENRYSEKNHTEFHENRYSEKPHGVSWKSL